MVTDVDDTSQALARLSSLASQLDDLVRGLGDVADQLQRAGRADSSSLLFEAERSLTAASRRLETARRSLH